MVEGMLWFDNATDRGLVDKVERAARYYADKRGMLPTTCYVHPGMLTPGKAASVSVKGGVVEVKPTNSVLLNHFWLGVEEESFRQQRPAA